MISLKKMKIRLEKAIRRKINEAIFIEYAKQNGIQFSGELMDPN